MIERGEKVWGGLTMDGGKQVRTIVCAKTQKEAASLVGMTLHHFRGYWSETGNAVELAVCDRTSGKVFRATTSMGCDFRAYKF